MRTMVCSVPKSGTYLVGNLLAQIGLENTHLHLGPMGSSDYTNATMDEARTNPDVFRIDEPLDSIVQRIKDNQFAVSHLGPGAIPLLQGFSVIFCYRNLREVVISFARWTHRTGRWQSGDQSWRQLPDGPERVLSFFLKEKRVLRQIIEPTIGWKNQNVVKVAYEEFVGDLGTDRVLSTLRRVTCAAGFSWTDAELLRMLEQTLIGETLTKSPGRSRIQEYWSADLEQLFIEEGFAYLNRCLGYEEKESSLPREAEQGNEGIWRRIRELLFCAPQELRHR